MPEGPEIRLAADKVAKVVENHTIEKIEVGLPALSPFVPKLTGKKVRAVETRGKAFLTHFENDLTIYSHNQLYGLWVVSERGHYPDTKRQLRLALHTQTHSALLYSASDISVWQVSELHNQPLLAKLGPDIMSPSLTVDGIVARLQHPKFTNRKLSILYLDQAFIAGSGNYLRSEILFSAGLHPDLKPSQLSAAQQVILAQATIDIARRSYQTRGYTIPDALYQSLHQKIDHHVADYEGTRFMVFDREGLPCRVCATPITKDTRNGRRIYWCPQCQPCVSSPTGYILCDIKS